MKSPTMLGIGARVTSQRYRHIPSTQRSGGLTAFSPDARAMLIHVKNGYFGGHFLATKAVMGKMIVTFYCQLFKGYPMYILTFKSGIMR